MSQISVLIIDTNKNMQNIVRAMVHGFGVKRVDLCSDGAEALGILTEKEIDVVICDLEMTTIDGYEFLKFLRWSSDSPARRIPVIDLSAQAEKKKIIATRDAGANEFVAKPVSPKMLRQRIEAVLARPREFVTSVEFNGPDRRRRDGDADGMNRRFRGTADTVEIE